MSSSALLSNRAAALSAQAEACALEREILEKKMESRLATLAEFDLIKLQSLRRAQRNVHARRAALSEKSAAVLRDAALCTVRVRDALAGKPALTVGQESNAENQNGENETGRFRKRERWRDRE